MFKLYAQTHPFCTYFAYFFMFLKSPNTFEILVYARHIDDHNSLYIMYGSSFQYTKVMFCDASDCGAVDHYF